MRNAKNAHRPVAVETTIKECNGRRWERIQGPVVLRAEREESVSDDVQLGSQEARSMGSFIKKGSMGERRKSMSFELHFGSGDLEMTERHRVDMSLSLIHI